ncbi:MAG: hypothetical protein IT280_02995 [Ignavibacteria bacterium]|nr:hypothetical protein [Ignavibacteria bacterium]
MNNSKITNFIIAAVLILFAAFSRLIPHPMNFAPIAAIALFAGAYLGKKFAFIVPVAAMLLSDIFIGFYSGIEWVYGSFAVIAFIGLWLGKKINGKTGLTKTAYIFGTALVTSVIFFIITNFGVWLSGMFYEMNFKGLAECYTMAIPFFRNSLAGDLFYAAAMFGIYELVIKFSGKTALQEARIKK